MGQVNYKKDPFEELFFFVIGQNFLQSFGDSKGKSLSVILLGMVILILGRKV